ncbi:GH21992 [Drosophila grimshawi]|uniref:GH21992 n=1 Tax=Drosophila grimshawi TaxID=7222 RepID=B4J962_DROGR|nr:GH21992 [Drosophila grimshawi]
MLDVCLLLALSLVAANQLKDLLEDTTPRSTTASTTTSTTTTTAATTISAYVISAAAVPAYNAATTMSKPKSKLSNGKYFNKSAPKKRKAEEVSSLPLPIDTDGLLEWKCPNISGTRNAELECGCDLPHTLRCNIDLHGLLLLADRLRSSPYSISLLDCSLRNVTFLSDAKIFDGISLHGLVISSGEIKRVHKSAFLGIKGPLQALGLPGNALLSVPWNALSTLSSLERLDLANNKIKALGTSDFVALNNLVYLELSNNQISSISQRTFGSLRKLEVLKLGGNRLGDYAQGLKALSLCLSLRQLDLTANNLNGPLSEQTLPGLRNLESLNLNRNMIKSIQNKALANFSRLVSLSLRHNQIDVLQDHAFYGLGALDSLDLSYNGIVAISSASLQHLTRLTVLDLTHNFLRALTSDLIAPLPSLRELRLAGNDISIVARNAMDRAQELQSLQMQDNPLSCDCSIRPFAEWLQVSKLSSSLSASCVTPPRLEGAPLLQVPVETLTCDMDNVEKDNANIMEHLETLAKPNQTASHVKDLSEEIILHELHYSADYGLILTWLLNLSKKDYMCDAIFVYKEENINEILIDNSPIHCESKVVNGQNTVSVIVPDSSSLDIGESYRFCLVMVQEQNPKADLNIGCSNITQLQLSSPGAMPVPRQYQRRPYYTPHELEPEHDTGEDYQLSKRQFSSQQQLHPNQQAPPRLLHTYNVIDSLNKSFLPGLGLGILVTSVVVLIWGATRIRQNVVVNRGGEASLSSNSSSMHHTNINNNNNNNNNGSGNSRPGTPTATTCYAASDHIARMADAENGTRYLKLQATTSL